MSSDRSEAQQPCYDQELDEVQPERDSSHKRKATNDSAMFGSHYSPKRVKTSTLVGTTQSERNISFSPIQRDLRLRCLILLDDRLLGGSSDGRHPL